MPAVLTLVADAVAELLTGASAEFGLEFVATRSYPPKDLELKELNELRVDVVVVGHEEATAVDRGTTASYLCVVDLGIRKKFSRSERDSDTGQVEKAEMDRLVELPEQFHQLLIDPQNRSLKQQFNVNASHESFDIRQTYNPRHFREWQQFTSIMRVKYRTFRK